MNAHICPIDKPMGIFSLDERSYLPNWDIFLEEMLNISQAQQVTNCTDFSFHLLPQESSMSKYNN